MTGWQRVGNCLIRVTRHSLCSSLPTDLTNRPVKKRPSYFPRHLSSPKPGHTTSGSGRGARRGGGAGLGRTGRRQNSTPRRQASLVPPKASKTRLLNVSPEARTSEILFKPMGEQSPRLTRGLSAVYHRDEKRSLFLAAD